MKRHLLPAILLFIFCSGIKAQTVALTPFVSGLTNPIDIKHCGDDRLFVAERNGRIRVINADGTLRTTPFLDIISKVSGLAGEEGFLGICFSPNYKTDGKFYVSYTAYAGAQLISVIEQYKVSANDSNLADPTSALRLLTVNQPFTNHKGGNILFGPDGYLYIFWGDGGSGGDPYGNGQNKTVLLGKIHRIDVSNSSTSQLYAIPPTNPFADSTSPNIRKEIWAYGLRNPFRDSFDPITGDFWIGDVGQNAHEEIDFQPVGDKGGHNYGWNTMEGFSCYSPSSNCDSTGITPPMYDYPHSVGYCIIGGHVYRSAQSRKMWGTYIFADYVSQWIDGLTQTNGKLNTVVRMLNSTGGGGPISFGIDRYNDQYVCLNSNGTIYRLNDADPNPFPKAYFTPTLISDTNYILKALEGRNITYQWLYENAAVTNATTPTFNANAQGTYQLVVTNSLGNKDTSAPFIIAASQVALENFQGRRVDNKQVQLTWQTFAEQNNSGFEIERKLDIDTGFKDIAFVSSLAANGNSITQIDYLYNDTPIYKGNIQYRLKQVNVDGTFSYSGVVLIAPLSLKLDVIIHPNPTKGTVYFSMNNTDSYLYQLIDMNGRKLLQNNFSGNASQFNVGFLQSGVYYLKITSLKSSEHVSKKVIVTH